MGDTSEEEVLHIPPDHELEADFDVHEAPTKPGLPPGLSDEIIDVRTDLRTLLVAAATLFGQMEYAKDATRHTAQIGKARFALAQLVKKYEGLS